MGQNRAKPIFISYASEDWKIAGLLAWELECLGYRTWLDRRQLRGGESWEDAIEGRLTAASRVVALLTPTSIAKSGYVKQEWRQAERIARSREGGHPFFIPVIFKSSKFAHGGSFRWCTAPIRLDGRWLSGIRELRAWLPNPNHVPQLEDLLLGTCWSAITIVDAWLEAWVFQFCAFGDLAYSNLSNRLAWVNKGDYQKRKKQEEPWRTDGRWKVEGQVLEVALLPYEASMSLRLEESRLVGTAKFRSGWIEDMILFNEPGVLLTDIAGQRIKFLLEAQRRETLRSCFTVDLLDLTSPEGGTL